MAQQSWSDFFFSLEGRVGRKRYWLHYFLPIIIPAAIASAVIDEMTGYHDRSGPGSLVFLLILWPSIAVQGKRWHDRNKSAWWILIGVIPIIGTIWAIVENGFLQGTEGPNRFGDVPLE